jgi:hypothetical protein
MNWRRLDGNVSIRAQDHSALGGAQTLPANLDRALVDLSAPVSRA